jgi:hypothetical protein
MYISALRYGWVERLLWIYWLTVVGIRVVPIWMTVFCGTFSVRWKNESGVNYTGLHEKKGIRGRASCLRHPSFLCAVDGRTFGVLGENNCVHAASSA